MGFSDLPTIEKTDKYLDTAFRKARTNARNHTLPENERSVLRREQALTVIKISTVNDYLVDQLQNIIAKYPNFDNLTEFYTQLLKLTLDYRALKKSLGSIDWAVGKLKFFTREFIRKVKRSSDPKAVSGLATQYYGRVSSVLRQINSELSNLHLARQVLRSFPSLKEDLFTVCIAGFPNVGKSTLLSKITPAKPEIDNYAFTTKRLNLGYYTRNGVKIQFMDTPGTLNRFEKMNPVEKQAHLAIRYVANYIVYVFDLTESAYSLHEQQKLLKQLKETGKSIICYLSKTDLLDDHQIESFEHLFSNKKIPLMTSQDELLDYVYDACIESMR